MHINEASGGLFKKEISSSRELLSNKSLLRSVVKIESRVCTDRHTVNYYSKFTQ